jgi:cation transport regulator ChaB
MTGIGGGRDPGDLSWTNEELPLEVRRALLDKALEDFKAAKALGNARAKVRPASDRAGKTGSERGPARVKDKPKA